MPPCVVKRDAKGRFAGCMPGTGGGSRGSGGGSRKKSGGGGLASQKVDDLQELAKKEGIDLDTLSYKARRSVLVKAIEAKRAGKNLREEGVLKPTKPKANRRGDPPGSKKSVGKSKTGSPNLVVNEDKRSQTKQYKEWEKYQEQFSSVARVAAEKTSLDKRSQGFDFVDNYKSPGGEVPRQFGHWEHFKKPRSEWTAQETAQAKALVEKGRESVKKERSRLDSEFAKLDPKIREVASDPVVLQRISSAQWVGGSAMSDSKRIAINDDKGNMQSIFSYSHSKKNGLEINYLATAPWNIAGNDTKSVRGAGTQAIAAAIRKSQELGSDGQVKLTALADAVPFYKKMGFKEDEFFGNGAGEMILPAASAKSLLKKLGG